MLPLKQCRVFADGPFDVILDVAPRCLVGIAGLSLSARCSHHERSATSRTRRRFAISIDRSSPSVVAGPIVRPFVHYVAPEWGATKQGPPAFPVKVHIGGETIAFTNGSTVAWSCEASLGLSKQRFSFSIDPYGTRELSYVHLRGSGSQTEVGVLRDAARGLIDITCAEPSGRTHLWQFD
jgi:hypothetical protein